jgi:hypothetical protein
MINYIIIIVLTAILSSNATLYAPNIVARYKRYRTRIHKRNMMGYRIEVLETQIHLLDRMIKEEVEKQLKDILDND